MNRINKGKNKEYKTIHKKTIAKYKMYKCRKTQD